MSRYHRVAPVELPLTYRGFVIRQGKDAPGNTVYYAYYKDIRIAVADGVEEMKQAIDEEGKVWKTNPQLWAIRNLL